ncbi:MAG: hypothetical protein CL917_16010 [Deltaproteobacteria bacterium]|nr:hypothetical protein [Deltaproteobacteria bacterium]
MTGLEISPHVPIPTLIMAVFALTILVIGVWFRPSWQTRGARVELFLSFLSLAGVGACVIWSITQMGLNIQPDPSEMFVFDPLAAVSTILVALAAGAIILLSSTYLSSYRLPQAEYYALLLFSLSGCFLCFGSEHLLLLVLGIELATLPIVFLVGYDFERHSSSEAAQKALFAGALSSAVMLYGAAFLYGATGHLDFASLKVLLNPEQPLALAGLAFVFVGLAMKLGLVPFHQWFPDVDQGAPTSVSVYIVVCGMTTMVLVWLRLILHGLPEMQWLLTPVFLVLSIVTLFFANLMALFQRNLKRMLAWLAVAQLGTFMLAFAAHSPEAYSALIFYLGAQAVGMTGAFGIIMTTAEGGRERDRLEHFAGIARHRKVLAVAMTVFMLTLAGIPGMAGFWARWQLLSAVVAAGDLSFVVVQTLASVISLYICMRVPIVMFMREELEVSESFLPSTTELVVLLACVAVAFGFGLWPNPELPFEWGESLMGLLYFSVSG